MNDKLKKLYDLYTSSGLIQNATFEDFASANEEQRKKLYNLGKNRGLFQTTEFNTFDSAFAIEPIEETPPVKKKDATESVSDDYSSALSWMAKARYQSASPEEKNMMILTGYHKPVNDKPIVLLDQNQLQPPLPETEKKEESELNKLLNADSSLFGSIKTTEDINEYFTQKEIDKNLLRNLNSAERKNLINDSKSDAEAKKRLDRYLDEWVKIKASSGDNDEAFYRKSLNSDAIKSLAIKEVMVKSPNEINYINRKNELNEALKESGVPTHFYKDDSFDLEDFLQDENVFQWGATGMDKEWNWLKDFDGKQPVGSQSFYVLNAVNNPNGYGRKRRPDDDKFVEGETIDVSTFGGDPFKAIKENKYTNKDQIGYNIREAVTSGNTDAWFSDRYIDLKKWNTSINKQWANYTEKVNQHNALVSSNNYMDKSAMQRAEKELNSERVKLLKQQAFIDNAREELDELKIQYNDVYNREYYKKKEKDGGFVGGLFKSFYEGITSMPQAIGSVGVSLTPGELLIGPDGVSAYDLEKAGGDRALAAKNEVKRVYIGLMDKASEAISNTSEEYMNSEDRGMFQQALNSVVNSVATAVSGGGHGALTKAAFFSMSYNIMDEEMSDERFDDMSTAQKMAVAGTYGMIIGALEQLGYKLSTGALKNFKGIDRFVAQSLRGVPKGSSREVIETAINNNLQAKLLSGALKVESGALVETATEESQTLLGDIVMKNVVNNLNEYEYFQDVPSTIAEAYEAIKEEIGVTLIASHIFALGGGAKEAVTNGISNMKSDRAFQADMDILNDDGTRAQAYEAIAKKVESGEITKEEGESQINSIKEMYSIINSMPEEMTTRQKKESFNLILERNRLEKEIEGKDKALVENKIQRVNEINEQLKLISKEDAVQEQSTAEVSDVEASRVSEEVEEGLPTTEPEVVTEEGKAKLTPSLQDKITIAKEQKEFLLEGTIKPRDGQSLDEAIKERDDLINKIESDPIGYLEEELADNEAKGYDALAQRDREELAILRKQEPQVVTEEGKKKVEKITDATTGKEFDIVFDRVDQKSGEPTAIELSDGWTYVRLDNGEYTDGDQVYDSYDQLIELGKKGGFIDEMTKSPTIERENEIRARESVQEMSSQGTFQTLTEEAFWNKASDFLAKKLGYESPMQAQEASPQDAEIWKNLTAKAMDMWNRGEIKGEQDLNKILETTTPTANQITVDNELEFIQQAADKDIETVKAAGRVVKALEKLGVKVFLHNNTDEYNQGISNATGMSKKDIDAETTKSNGEFITDKNEIHINLENADAKTVFHEAFHAVVLGRGFDVADISRFVKAVKKSGNLSKEDIQKLDDFSNQYEAGEVNEEFLSELVGGLASSAKTMSRNQLQKLIDAINTLFEKIGLGTPFEGRAERKEVVDFLNEMSQSLSQGREIDVTTTGISNIDIINSVNRKKQATIIKNREKTLEEFGLEGKKSYTVREIGAALDKRTKKEFKKFKKDDYSNKAKETISNYIVDELVFELESKDANSAVGWYTEKFQKAIDILAEKDQSLLQKDNRDVFTMFMAVTSDGQKVSKNFELAYKAYSEWNKKGKVNVEAFPKTGDRTSSIKGNLKAINRLLSQGKSVSEVVSDLLTEKTVGELKREDKNFKSNYLVSEKVPKAAGIFGEKLGAFYANLSGSTGYLTMDRWWSRTFNRYRGQLIPVIPGSSKDPVDSKGRPKGLAKFKVMVGQPNITDNKALKIVQKEAKSYSDKGFKNGTDVEKASNTIYKAAFINLNDAPFNASDRSFMIETTKIAQKKLKDEFGYDMSIADIQAVLWYFEKRLYKEVGGKDSKDVSYEDVARSEAKKDGLVDIESPDTNLISVSPDISEVNNSVENINNSNLINEQKINKVNRKMQIAPGNRMFNEPLTDAKTIADKYMSDNNIDIVEVEKIKKVDKERAKRISDEYDKMINDPANPEVKEAYEAMVKETMDQYNAITSKGYFVEINNSEPYSSSAEMIQDLKDNKRFKVLSTEAEFGDTPITDAQRKENILLTDSGKKDINGKTLLVNDVFRFVHDFFGHAKLGNSFGPIGEENAWRVHSVMYSDKARRAMTSETRGQNSFVNFSGVNDAVFKKRDKARQLRREGKTEQADKLVGEVYDEMKFADQKIGLMPEWTATEGAPVSRKKQISEDKKGVDFIYEASNKAILEKRKKTNVKKGLRFTREKTLDRQASIKSLLKSIGSKKSARAHDLLITKAGAKGWANYRFLEAEKKIYKGLRRKDVESLDKMIYVRRIIAINENRRERGLNPYTGMKGYSEADAVRDLQSMRNKMGDKKFNDLMGRSDAYFDTFKENLKSLYESGRITEETYDNLSNVEYSPIATIKYIIDDNLTDEEIDKQAEMFGMTSKDIRELTDKNENEIIMDSRWLLMMNVMAVEGRAWENKMLKSFDDAFQSMTQEEKQGISEYIIENPVVGEKSNGELKYKYTPSNTPVGFRAVTYYKDGNKRHIIIKREYARQLLDIKNSSNLEKGLQAIGKLTGANVLRFFATSGNPLFIVGNTALDFGNILFFSNVYGSKKWWNPLGKTIGAVELAFDFTKNAIRKMVSTGKYKEIYKEYVEHGGAMDFLSNDGLKAIKGSTWLKKNLAPVQKVLVGYGKLLSYFGALSEQSFRIAVYEKTRNEMIKQWKKDNNTIANPKGQDLEDILYAAARESRETIDFSQGGDWVKSADAVAPYLNASMQGYRRLQDYAQKDPKGFASSMIQGTTMAASLAWYSIATLISAMPGDDEEEKKRNAREALNSISDHEKATYHIIFTGKKDEEGNWQYYRIKKLPGLSVAATIAENLSYKYMFDIKDDVVDESVSKSFDLSLPIGITDVASRNPLVSGIIASFGWDTYRWEPVFRSPQGKIIKPSSEGLYDDRVEGFYKSFSQAAKEVGFEISPIRTKAAIEKLITNPSTNPSVSIYYAALNGLFSDGEMIDKDKTLLSDLGENVSKKMIRYTNPDLKRYSEQEEREEAKAIQNSKEYDADSKIYRDIKRKIKKKEDIKAEWLLDQVKNSYDPMEYESKFKKFFAYTRNNNVDRELIDILYERDPKVQAEYIRLKYGNTLEQEEAKELFGELAKSPNLRIPDKTWYYYMKGK